MAELKKSLLKATPAHIVIMLYDAAIRYTKKAVVALETKDIPEKGIMIGKAYEVISELKFALDGTDTRAAELVSNLEALYDYMMDELTKANIMNEVKHLHTILKVLETIRDGFAKAQEAQKRGVSVEGTVKNKEIEQNGIHKTISKFE